MKRKESSTPAPPAESLIITEVGKSIAQPGTGKDEDVELTQLELATCGLKKFEDTMITDLASTIFIRPEKHISAKYILNEMEQCVPLVGCDKSWIITEWYAKLSTTEKDIIRRAGFEPVIKSLHNTKPDPGLLQALAEKWWDTTHTFHFECLGEMTMTPIDFTAITGLRVSGTPLYPRKVFDADRNLLRELLGHKIEAVTADTVTGTWLWDTYGNIEIVSGKECYVTVRAFILALIGCVFVSNEQNTVNIAYVYWLEDVENIDKLNWGGTALAYQYNQMDDLCRGSSTWIGGLWRSWEVWAKEYIPWIVLVQPPDTDIIFPQIQRWNNQTVADYDLRIMINYYRLKFKLVQIQQVVWDLFAKTTNLPSYVTASKRTSNQRVLLVGLQGGTWYLGERVRRQIAGLHQGVVPKNPPTSMMKPSTKKIKDIKAAITGKPFRFYVDKNFGNSYEVYRNRLAQALAAALPKPSCPSNDDDFNLPAWMVIVPSSNDESDLIPIPMDKRMKNYDIPESVTAISRTKAIKLLDMIAGLHHLLMHYIVDSKNKSRISTAEIQHLRHQLACIKEDVHSDSSY